MHECHRHGKVGPGDKNRVGMHDDGKAEKGVKAYKG